MLILRWLDRRSGASLSSLALLIAVLGLTAPALAQDDAGGLGDPSEEDSDSAGMAAPPEEEEDEAPPDRDDEVAADVDLSPENVSLADDQADIEDAEGDDETFDALDPREVANTDYFFLGAMGRAVIIPGFIQQLFVQGGIDGFNPATGLTFNWRRNDFNVVVDAWWNNAQADGYFRANGDPPTDTEYIDVDLFAFFINASFLWSFPITDWFAFELGFDLGIGFLGGSLVRTEAYETSPGNEQYEPCDGPGDPNAPPGYCEPAIPASSPCYDTDGGHYGCSEPNWFTEGGDTPFVFPWVSLPHIAVRFKPIHQLQIRIDGGYGLYNFFFGGSISYGF